MLENQYVIYTTEYNFFLKDFVSKNDTLRKISPIHKQIGKNNNNTFYGRLGIRSEQERIVVITGDEGRFDKITEINGIRLGHKKTINNVSNVIIAAAITAKARVKLYKGFQAVLSSGGRLLYCDTDSIIAAFQKTNPVENKFLCDTEVCFDTSKEDTIIEKAVFAMPKTYAIKTSNNEIVKLKGFSNNNLSFCEFKQSFYNKKEISIENKI